MVDAWNAKTWFLCWDVENSCEDDAREIEAFDAERAARRLAERRYSDDYPDEQTIAVRAPDGTVTKWAVAAVPCVTFIARRVEEMR